MAILTILSFVLDDFRVLVLTEKADKYVDGMLVAIAVAFTVDLVARIRADPDFLFSRFCLFDIIALTGILSDVNVIYSLFFSECDTYHFSLLQLIPKAARTARFAVKFIGLLTAYKPAPTPKLSLKATTKIAPAPLDRRPRKASSVAPSRDNDQEQTEDGDKGSLRDIGRKKTDQQGAKHGMKKIGTFRKLYRENITKQKTSTLNGQLESLTESRISKNVTYRQVSRITFIGMLVSLCSWLIVPTLWFEDTRKSYEYGMVLMESFWNSSSFPNITQEFISAHRDTSALESLVRLSVNSADIFLVNETIRSSELCEYRWNNFRAVSCISGKVRILAVFELCMSLFFCGLLLFVCVHLSRDIRYMIIFPLEKMIEIVRLMTENPLKFVKMSPTPRPVNPSPRRNCCSSANNYAGKEIKLLENAFRKIGVMLALVYGSAGSQLISSTLQYEVDFSPIVIGKEILAIFCFARIANFEASLEALQAKILHYVNYLSLLVHYKCEKYFGAVNRNLGDAFLLVWKLPREEGITVNDKLVANPYSQLVKSAASLALLFAVKTVKRCASSLQLFQLLNKKGIFDSNFLSFGFHAGWAYEGPIGSQYKIDASYLSPNVNTASRVESATKLYGRPILLSQDMYFLLEDDVQLMTRHIETVVLKGTKDPMQIYSFDLSEFTTELTRNKPRKDQIGRKRYQLKDALERRLITISEMFTRSETIALMRKGYPKAFFDSYNSALQLYMSGDWRTAAKLCEEALGLVRTDKPTRVLLGVMEKCGLQAPVGWQGVRVLEGK